MSILSDDLLKLFLAILVGGIIGIEREFHQKAAGFRTIILICIGSTLFTMLSLKIEANTVRIAANIVTGIGFLGAGVIFREANRITGITTAATIWLTAALGLWIGSDHYLFALIVAIIVLIILLLFSQLERWLDSLNEIRRYQVLLPNDPDATSQIEQMVAQCGLHIRRQQQMKRQADLLVIWEISGKPPKQELFVQLLLAANNVKEFEY